MLMRPKKSQDIDQRVEEICKCPVSHHFVKKSISIYCTLLVIGWNFFPKNHRPSLIICIDLFVFFFYEGEEGADIFFKKNMYQI